MLLDIVTKGTTDYSCTLKVLDATTGAPATGLAFNSSGIDLWYRRPQSAHTSITEATQTEGGAHSDGGFVEISDGVYRLDLPDAAVATGVDWVDVGGTITGYVVIGGRIRLTSVDLENSVRAGLTALPNAAADAAGGLPISDAGGLDLDTILTKITGGGVRVDWSAIQNPTATVGLTGTTVGLIANALAASNIATGAITNAKFASGALDAAALAADAGTEIAAAVKAMVVESNGSVTLGQAMSIFLAVLAGVSTGQATTSPVFKDHSGTNDRVTGTTDGSGNRSAVTLSPSS